MQARPGAPLCGDTWVAVEHLEVRVWALHGISEERIPKEELKVPHNEVFGYSKSLEVPESSHQTQKEQP